MKKGWCCGGEVEELLVVTAAPEADADADADVDVDEDEDNEGIEEEPNVSVPSLARGEPSEKPRRLHKRDQLSCGTGVKLRR